MCKFLYASYTTIKLERKIKSVCSWEKEIKHVMQLYPCIYMWNYIRITIIESRQLHYRTKKICGEEVIKFLDTGNNWWETSRFS